MHTYYEEGHDREQGQLRGLSWLFQSGGGWDRDDTKTTKTHQNHTKTEY